MSCTVDLVHACQSPVTRVSISHHVILRHALITDTQTRIDVYSVHYYRCFTLDRGVGSIGNVNM